MMPELSDDNMLLLRSRCWPKKPQRKRDAVFSSVADKGEENTIKKTSSNPEDIGLHQKT